MEHGMSMTELNTTNEIRTISDDELADVAGGFQVYTGGGGGGRVVSHGPSGSDIVGVFGFLALVAIGFSL